MTRPSLASPLDPLCTDLLETIGLKGWVIRRLSIVLRKDQPVHVCCEVWQDEPGGKLLDAPKPVNFVLHRRPRQ